MMVANFVQKLNGLWTFILCWTQCFLATTYNVGESNLNKENNFELGRKMKKR